MGILCKGKVYSDYIKNSEFETTKVFEREFFLSDNDEFRHRNFCDSSQLTNWILDYGSKYHIKPEVSDFNPGSLEDTDKHIEVTDGHHVTAKQKGLVQIKCVTIMDILSSQRYTTYFWHQIYATGYFQSSH